MKHDVLHVCRDINKSTNKSVWIVIKKLVNMYHRHGSVAKWNSVLKIPSRVHSKDSRKGWKIPITLLKYLYSSPFLVYNDLIMPQVHGQNCGLFLFP